MALDDGGALDRFRRRTLTTDEATLYRNLSVGVYGPPGSAERATAEHALRERFESTAEAYRVATRSEAGLVAERLERVSRMAKRALVIALAALGAALLALARAFGVW